MSSLLPVVSKGHNLIGVTDGSAGWVASDLTGTSAHPFDPVLVLFPSINGGPTWTVALDPGSPAMDSGDNALAVDPSGNPLANDQRGPGYPRIVNGTVDIGAFEYQTNTRTVLTSSSPSSAYGGQVTFTITVTEGGAPVTAGDVTIMNGNNELVASLALDASGRASFSTSSLRVSPVPYVIRDLYNGAAAAQPSSATLRQTITPAPLTVRAVAQSKIYDGTTGATVALSDNRLPGDQLTVTAVLAAFTDPNAGAGKTVVVSGITLSGPAAANYSLVSPTATTTADIFKANQTIVWSNPATVGSGTPLGPVQLNAKVLGVPGGSAPGALTYSPPAGTVLPPGKNETLTVTAAATINYNSATATVDIKVQSLVQEAAALTRQVQAVASTGAIGHCQADELTDKLRLSGRPRDLGQVVGFIQDVGSLAGRGALGRRTAKALVSGADTLLTGLRAAFRRRTGH